MRRTSKQVWVVLHSFVLAFMMSVPCALGEVSEVMKGFTNHLAQAEQAYADRNFKAADEILKDACVPTRLEFVEGGGHEFPADYAKRFPSAVQFVLTGGTTGGPRQDK